MKSRKPAILVTVALAGSLLGAAAVWVSQQADSASTGLSDVAQAETPPKQARDSSVGGDHGPPGENPAADPRLGNGHAIRLTPEQTERLGIRVERLEAGSAGSTITRPATIAFDLDRIARIGPRITSKVVSVSKDLGVEVKKGEVLAVLTSVELGLVETRYLAAKARMETEYSNYIREQGLFKKHISSEAEMLEARARYREAEANLDAARDTLQLYGLSSKEIEEVHERGEHTLSYLYLTSPIDGVVQRRDLAPGDTVDPSETPILVVNSERMWVMIDAFEHDVSRLAPGQRVEVTLQSLPGHTFRGTVDWISQELEKETRTVRVRAIVDNPERLLRAGMFGTARIAIGGGSITAMAPVDAIQTLDGKKVVFMLGDEGGTFMPVPVTLGEESDGLVEILSGALPGQQVVTEGAFSLKSALEAGGPNAYDAD